MTIDAIEDGESLAQRAALFAAGAMTATEAAHWEAALAVPHSAEYRATAEFEIALLKLSAIIQPVEPPSGILAVLQKEIAPPSGIIFRFASDGRFRPSPTPGVAFKLLHRDKARKVVTCLLRLDAGAYLPSHSHSGAEECLVLEGSILVGHTRMRAGDYQRAESDSEHVEQWTDTGALLYLTTHESLFLNC